jgi:hypothetical protein
MTLSVLSIARVSSWALLVSILLTDDQRVDSLREQAGETIAYWRSLMRPVSCVSDIVWLAKRYIAASFPTVAQFLSVQLLSVLERTWEETRMKKWVSIISGLLLAAAFCSPAMAKGKGSGKGGESQAGGLPGLEDRVEADEALIATLQSEVAAIQGQNNFAVVASDGVLVRSSSNAGAVTVDHVATGQYEVTFSENVSACAYEATIGDTGIAVPVQGQISVSGDVDSDNTGDVYVQTFDTTGLVATDMPFHLTVTCP